jgi:hypothetical protein
MGTPYVYMYMNIYKITYIYIYAYILYMPRHCGVLILVPIAAKWVSFLGTVIVVEKRALDYALKA